MTLRAKLLLAQAPLALALALVGAASVSAIASLGLSPALILRDNYRSVLAAERMLRAEKDLDDFALARAAGRAGADAERARATASFEAELHAQESNITERGEAEATRDMRGRWAKYLRALDAVVAASPRARLDVYFDAFMPAARELQHAAQDILAINQDAMQRKSDQARRAAEHTTAEVIGVIVAAVAAGLAASVWLMARLLRPLAALSHTVRRIGEGDLDVRAPVAGRDEIAALGVEFNTMAERLRQYRSSSLGELLQAQQASQAAIDSLPDPVVVVDASGAILNLNGAAEALFRRGGGVAPSVTALEPELRATVERVRAHVLAGKGAYVPRGFDEAVRVEGADGARSLLPRASPLYSEQGSITGATIVLQDVTRLMRFDELKNDLVATVAHEFRTPLTSLRMAIHLCADELVGPLTDKQGDLMLAARQDCERLQSIVDDLLDLSRIQSGRLELAWGSAAPSELVGVVLEAHRAEAAAKGIQLTGIAGRHLPKVRVDRERVELVISNLLANAVRHSPRGGTVEVTAVEGEGSVRFEVKDSGPGIAAEHQDRIFEKFYRIPGAPAGGVGLGLYLAREIVEAHGGRIGVESAPGVGSRFWFTVPRADAASSPPADEPRPAA
ncbi:HAMP domain-containing sensor histidine kinase [Anaeromyxobacter diazotrophicus]|uniref:histidine kinase n=1 Tax=Anaeromyxobacter diazotrophicus TaxID=2590199 RepID=A0A7I9VGV1_9BACT|nr:ATP-binding protein [Anaeromyxobacter diazotrophicus]GEJ55469.1 PAS domain-containing sensor histidine kinase [Anaeromyxobacter diazotrophicus]